jgi:hypothetical protein
VVQLPGAVADPHEVGARVEEASVGGRPALFVDTFTRSTILADSCRQQSGETNQQSGGTNQHSGMAAALRQIAALTSRGWQLQQEIAHGAHNHPPRTPRTTAQQRTQTDF